jgi:hypothetical protein
MGAHDTYGKAVMRLAAGDAYTAVGFVHYGTRSPAQIDGTIADIAIEIESRVSKQVRGAVLDLICHDHPKKLLALFPVHMGYPTETATQCRNILGRFVKPHNFRVIVLQGNGTSPATDEDVATVRAALSELVWSGG